MYMYEKNARTIVLDWKTSCIAAHIYSSPWRVVRGTNNVICKCQESLEDSMQSKHKVLSCRTGNVFITCTKQMFKLIID